MLKMVWTSGSSGISKYLSGLKVNVTHSNFDNYQKKYDLVEFRLYMIRLATNGETIDRVALHKSLISEIPLIKEFYSFIKRDNSPDTKRKLYKVFDLVLFSKSKLDDPLSVFFSGIIDDVLKQNLKSEEKFNWDYVRYYIDPVKRGQQDNSAQEDDDLDDDSEINVDDVISDKVLTTYISDYVEKESIWVNSFNCSPVCSSVWKLLSDEFGQLNEEGQYFIFELIQELFSGLLKVTVKREDLLVRYFNQFKGNSDEESVIKGLYQYKFGSSLERSNRETQIERVKTFLTDLLDSQGTINPLSNITTKRQGLWRGTYLQKTPVTLTLTGSKDKGDARLRKCDAFNSPLLPDIFICSTIGSEGIDLHRYCRNVIHHDLPWNPASLEQKTGRIDRVNSLAERINAEGNNEIKHFINVGIPFLANNYDQYQYDVLVERAQKFEVLFGDPDILEDMERYANQNDRENESDENEIDDEEAVSTKPIEATKPLPDNLIEFLSIDLSV